MRYQVILRAGTAERVFAEADDAYPALSMFESACKRAFLTPTEVVLVERTEVRKETAGREC